MKTFLERLARVREAIGDDYEIRVHHAAGCTRARHHVPGGPCSCVPKIFARDRDGREFVVTSDGLLEPRAPTIADDDTLAPGLVASPVERLTLDGDAARAHLERLAFTPFDEAHCAACSRRMPDGPGGVVEGQFGNARGMLVRQFGVCDRCASTARNLRRAMRWVQRRIERASEAALS